MQIFVLKNENHANRQTYVSVIFDDRVLVLDTHLQQLLSG